MTPTEVKQAADEMVEMFMPFAYYNPESANILKEQVSNATRIAIAHCKRVIEELEEITFSRYDNHARSSIENRINHYRLILSELEGRVK